MEANPGVAHTKINALLGAIWSDYKKQMGTENTRATGVTGAKAKRRKTPPKSGKAVKQSVSSVLKQLLSRGFCSLWEAVHRLGF